MNPIIPGTSNYGYLMRIGNHEGRTIMAYPRTGFERQVFIFSDNCNGTITNGTVNYICYTGLVGYNDTLWKRGKCHCKQPSL